VSQRERVFHHPYAPPTAVITTAENAFIGPRELTLADELDVLSAFLFIIVLFSFSAFL
jgi:hypothetical protein